MIRDLTEIIYLDIDLKKVSFVSNDKVFPPVPTICTNGEKPYSRLFYIKKGAMYFSEKIGGKPYLKAEAGSITYLPSDCNYYSEWDMGEVGAYENILFTAWSGGEQVLFSDKVICAVSANDNIYGDRFTEIRTEWKKGAPGYQWECKIKLYALLLAISKGKRRSEAKAKYKSIYKGIMHLENNYLENTSIAELAQMCHVSEGTFRRLFAEYKGETPVKYRNKLRIKKAAELLESGEYTVSEAAEAAAMPDAAYFSKLFKKLKGYNPSEIK